MTGLRVAVILKGYPRLSETFIAQELEGLERRGLDLRIISLRHPTDPETHPVHGRIRAPVAYLPEYLYREPLRVLRGAWRCRHLSGLGRVLRLFVRDFRRDPSPGRGRRLGQALVLAAELPAGTDWLYVHFLHTPASVARYAALLRGLPFSISAHAKDIWTIPEWEKAEKLADARWAATCTAFGRAHLDGLCPGRVRLIHHGLDFTEVPPRAPVAGDRDGRDPARPVRLLTVGRAVAKKGLEGLLDTLARLPADTAWHWDHIGGGDQAPALHRRAQALGLTPRITWHGPRAREAVLAACAQADLFVLPSRITASGDRDGLPNVLLEAQSQGVACLSTNLPGIAELIRDGETGTLVPPDDPDALARALAALIADPGERHRLAAAGHARVVADFGSAGGLDRLAALFPDAAAGRRAA